MHASAKLNKGALGIATIPAVLMMGPFEEVEFDFVAENPGLTLLHCHQQLHMDFGFMALLHYA